MRVSCMACDNKECALGGLCVWVWLVVFELSLVSAA